MARFGIFSLVVFFYVVAIFTCPTFAITLDNKVTNVQVQQICSHSANPNFCVQTLMHDRRTSRADINGVAGISLDISSANVNQAIRLLGGLVRSAPAQGPVRQRYQTCLREYTGAVRALNSARIALRSRNFQAFYDQSMATLNQVEDCRDEFEVPPVERSSLPGLTEKNAWLASINVAISGFLR